MPNFCKVVIVGHLTRDAELRYTQSGVSVAEVGICHNNSRKQGDNWIDEPCFLDCTAFGKLAERLGQQAHKGDAWLIEGKLAQDNWTDKSGAKRSKIKLIIDHAVNVSGRQPQREPQKPKHQAYDDDDSPF